MRNLHRLAALSPLLALLLPFQAIAASCYLDGNTGVAYTSPIQLGNTENLQQKKIACGHAVAGTGCTVEVAENISTANWCVAIGRGVTLAGQGKTITCNAGYCTDAAVLVGTSAPTGSGSATVENLGVAGCWFYGLKNEETFNAVANDVTIALPTSCTVYYLLGQPFSGGLYGIYGFSTVTRATVSNALETGIFLNSSNATVNDSIVRTCDTAIEVYNVTGTKLVNGLLDGNTRSVFAGTGNYRLDSQGSVLQNAGANGHCGPSSSIDDCVKFSGSRASFVDFVIK